MIQFLIFIIAVISPLSCFALDESYFEKLAKRCEQSESSNCCLASIKEMKRGLFKEAIDDSCPQGFKRNLMRCISSLAWCEPITEEDTCQNLGVEENIGFPSQPLSKCCGTLIRRMPKALCGQDIVGYFGGVCLACGNHHCDHGLENTCNCPEDCP